VVSGQLPVVRKTTGTTTFHGEYQKGSGSSCISVCAPCHAVASGE
jgi:hypothetical protein